MKCMLSEICMQQQMKQHNFYMIDKYIHNLQIQLKQEIYILSVETVLNFQKCMFAIRKCSDLPKNVGFSLAHLPP